MTVMMIVGTVVCAASMLICWAMTGVRKHPADSSIVSIAAVELFLLAYGLYAGVRQLGFDAAITGEVWEFWGYLATALLLPIGVFIWAMVDRTRWSNLVMSSVGLVVFVMVYRMEEIWWGSAL